MTQYFKTAEHFINFIKKTLRENPGCVNESRMLSAKAYTEALFETQPPLVDSFGIAVKHNPKLLEEEMFLEWLRNNKFAGWTLDSELEHNVTRKFCEEVDALHRKPGVYSFWSKKKTPLYIGMSVNLGGRILSSFNLRFRNYDRKIWFRYILTKTASDAAVFEVVLISKLKPAFNGSSKYKDNLTLDISIPDFSKPTLCNILVTKMESSNGQNF